MKDRAVPIAMRRKVASEPVERFRHRAADAVAEPLRAQLQRFADDRHDELHAAEPDLPAPLNDRAAEAWECLFAIADLAGGDWPRRARHAALALSGDDDDQASHGTLLLGAVRAAFNGSGAMSSADLATHINAQEQLPFGGWRDGRGLDQRLLARLLKPYGVRPDSVRLGDHTLKGYRREWFTDAWQRYAPIDCDGRQDAAGHEEVPPVPDVPPATEVSPAPRAGASQRLPACRCERPAIGPDEDGAPCCAKCGRPPA